MERMTLTKLGSLMEALRSDVERVAERLGGLINRVESIDGRLARVERELEEFGPIIKSLAPVPNALKTLTTRLEAVEAK